MSHVENGKEYHTHFLVDERDASILEGRILTLVELLGLEDKVQEEALKSEIRQKIWGGCFMKAVLIYGDEMPEVRKVVDTLEKKRVNKRIN